MVNFKAEIEKFQSMGEKTGWSYIFIPAALANKIKADCKKSFRVKGKIDSVEINGIATIPMGAGDFIIALKGALRKKLGKEEGAAVTLFLEEDKDFKVEMPEDLELCLSEEGFLMEQFLAQPKSHQNYFIRWINDAKTEATRTRRLAQTVSAMYKKQDFGAMIRAGKTEE
ncbi:YdeI/OmpD-associated family protein [Pedobacter sp. Leaf194]|uniref:YdeI/OmpD-associated family protein n=1 Tax=Pedobacter sp. Leaf194 TaxID=1736297 RepID=UPI00070389FB|nr:YdeI/OmpD-associated family protein [Pedobacter sp. Leaf194]KQS32287.1 hypothetical protein ASG14_17235 [Pedobacter sp. Leaf194]